MKLKGLCLSILIVFTVTSINAQRYNIGIRAGLNYSKILGPSEEGMIEGHGLNNGIHFGLTYAYKLTDKFGVKTELAYSSVGSKDSIIGDSYYIFGIAVDNNVQKGYAKRTFERTNSYINMPFHAYYKPNDKFEIFGGIYVGFLINPTSGGTLKFDDQSDETKFSFIQSLDYNYYSDKPLTDPDYRSKGTGAITTIVGDNTYQMPQVAGAYYQFTNKDGGLYKWFDAGLSGGVSYYINKSFFASVRVDYGLMDITRKAMDVSYKELNGSEYILRDDYDQNLSFQFSVGFKF
ncbi:outer membrane beta-barrel protein [Portibacter lacus]|uniref:Outer membrane protein beta-barrel domain-containing protein n=1 Tax=Portibacter lacus TaxID=1099794 RepID=A0AA37SNL0_9BACT|nr:outer membrane beta-barrel protein [Portibacter lacus]GLR18083.1 hypothetical protein GCM10007940_26980 [Portibacter lacus]